MRIIFVVFLLLSIQAISTAQSDLEQAEKHFKNRYENIENGYATKANINKAIMLFKSANSEPERTIGLLKSYEFKASWTKSSEEEKESLYESAIDLAERKVKEFPDNGALAYWHVANYARWADLIDITEAAQNGVIDEIKRLAEKAIDLNQRYNQAGALRLLGGVHLEAPNIPLVLSWPSNEAALELLRKAYEIAPQHPANAFLYAKALDVTDNEKKSKRVLENLIDREARNHFLLVDQKYLEKAIEFYTENFES